MVTALKDGSRSWTEGALRQKNDNGFLRIAQGHQSLPVGQCIDDFELIARACKPADLMNQMLHLPLR